MCPSKGMPTKGESLAPKGRCMIRLVGEQEQNRHNETDLIRIIESLRGQLVELVQEKGFDNGEVVELSQRLDQYIVQYQNRMKIKSIK
ncbi:aspartyl-phosphate phosphatase Spo0E family protein [Brevibacillus borstelensis]|jgi:hypothetical protein|uniref:aspartyl-phosphate phosphatase Spo0E family protein n=1 Tax=Brevibacillus borstelensis TaxID=45462 RepID=UPI002E1F6DC8